MAGIGNTIVQVIGSGNEIIDGLMYGAAWSGPITYAFPDVAADFGYGYETKRGFGGASAQQEDAALFVLDQSYGNAANDGFSVEGFTNVDISEGTTTGANIRLAESDTPTTSYAYMPGRIAQAGDVWLGARSQMGIAQAGNYAWQTITHELGHALGLKHGQESFHGFAPLPEKYDSMEYSVMTYRSYEGGNTGPYTYAHWSAPQTYMIADVAALQYMYGANFTTNSDDTTYKWSPTSGDTFVNGARAIDAGGTVIFATIWDGGGTDTYDLGAYADDLDIDLAPGGFSSFGEAQLADLGRGHSAHGSIYNALQYQGDARSLIENAIGGSGNDAIKGNSAANTLTGNGGQDHLFGRTGADILVGGDGRDRLVGGYGTDTLDGGLGNDRLRGGSGNDLLTGGQGADVFVFKTGSGSDTIADFQDGSDRLTLTGFGFTSATDAIAHAAQIGNDVVITLDDTTTVTLQNFAIENLSARDFTHFI